MHGKLCVSTLVILALGERAGAQTPARPTPPDPLPFTFTAPLRPVAFEPAADPAPTPAATATPHVTLAIPHTTTPTWLPDITFAAHMHWPRRPPRPPAPAKTTPAPLPRASFGGPLASPQAPAKFFP